MCLEQRYVFEKIRDSKENDIAFFAKTEEWCAGLVRRARRTDRLESNTEASRVRILERYLSRMDGGGWRKTRIYRTRLASPKCSAILAGN